MKETFGERNFPIQKVCQQNDNEIQPATRVSLGMIGKTVDSP